MDSPDSVIVPKQGENEQEEERFAFRFYARVVRDIVGSETASIFIYDPATDKLWLKASTGLAEREIEVPKHGSFVGQTIETGRRLVIRDATYLPGAHRATDAATHFVTRNVACVPVWSSRHNQVVGVVQAVNKKGEGSFSERDLQFMEDVARMLHGQTERIFLTQKVYEVASLMGVSVKSN